MTSWFPELCRASKCQHTALCTRRSCTSMSFLISLEKSLLRSCHAPSGGYTCSKFCFPVEAQIVSLATNAVIVYLDVISLLCSLLRKCRSHTQVWIIAVCLSFLLWCCMKKVASCNSQLRQLYTCFFSRRPWYLSLQEKCFMRTSHLTTQHVIKVYPPGLRSNENNDFYCFIKDTLKWK